MTSKEWFAKMSVFTERQRSDVGPTSHSLGSCCCDDGRVGGLSGTMMWCRCCYPRWVIFGVDSLRSGGGSNNDDISRVGRMLPY